MKLKYILLAFISVLLFSCEDGWLEPEPLSSLQPESILVSKEGMDGVLLGLRKGLRNEFYGSPNMLAYEYMSSDVAVTSNRSGTATRDFNIQMKTTDTGNAAYNFFRYWDHAYGLIKNANIIISRIDDIEWKNEQDKNEILGEAYFHRSYWYYRLVHQFGDVPFLNKEYTAPKFDFYSHSRKTILNKIQSDMEFAAQWLPDMVEPGKVNRAAGNHLLAKIYLANSNFDGAISATSNVINDGKHFLMTDRFGKYAGDSKYNILWDLHQKENKSLAENTEGILVVQDKFEFPESSVGGGTQAMRNYAPAWWRQYLKDPNGLVACNDGLAAFEDGSQQILTLGRGVGYCRGTNYYNYEIWKDCGSDLRHDTVVNWMPTSKIRYNNPNSEYFGQRVMIEYTNPSDTVHGWYPWPYYKVHVFDEEQLTKPMGGHSDWYLFRLAETYLLRAEAYYWKGKTGEAANDINKVRERALAAPISAGDVTLEYILDERARELYTEEARKTLLTRIAFIMADNGMNGYSLDNFHEKNYWFDRISDKNNFYNKIVWLGRPYSMSPYHVLWPIQEENIQSNSQGVINQNMGYPGAENNITPKTEISEED